MTLLPSTAIPNITSTIRTTVRKTANNATHYSEILKQVKAAGLLKKEPIFYIKRLAVITTISLALWGGIIALALTTPLAVSLPLVAVMMVLQGILAAQYGFIAHEASHRQVFHSNKTNDNVGRILANLFAGLSYGFWMKKHNRHHAKPNQIGEDPDINIRVLAFTTESLEEKKGFEKMLTRNQGWLFPILLFFTGFDLLLDSLIAVARKDKKVEHRLFEFGMMLVRQATPFVISFVLFQNVFIAAGLWVIMMCSFGFFMGGAFAPNHKGMALVARDAKIDFFQRQVLTSRNIKSSWWTDNLMGGLNFQVEHHLFPSMARPHLRAAHLLVKQYCATHSIPFVEMKLLPSYGVVIRYLNKVGLSGNSDPFVCPMIAELRPRN